MLRRAVFLDLNGTLVLPILVERLSHASHVADSLTDAVAWVLGPS